MDIRAEWKSSQLRIDGLLSDKGSRTIEFVRNNQLYFKLPLQIIDIQLLSKHAGINLNFNCGNFVNRETNLI